MSKVAVYLSGFYLIYTLLLSRDTLYSRNRKFILFSILSSLIFPFITIQTTNPIEVPVLGKVLSEVFITASKGGNESAASGIKEFGVLQIINLVYLAGIIVFSLKLIIDFLELIYLILREKTKDKKTIMFYGLNTAGFSALGQIFINSRLSPEEAAEIIRHEQNHLDHNHFFDILLIEIVKIFQWFNPVIHLTARSLRAVHEFQADEGCLKKGINVVGYQRLLLNQLFRTNVFSLTNSFSNPSLIKKRMIMMTKKRSRTTANLKLILVLPVIALILAAFSSSKERDMTEMKKTETINGPGPVIVNPVSSENSPSLRSADFELLPAPPPAVPDKPENGQGRITRGSQQITSGNASKTEPFVVVDEMPLFPGGDVALLKYIAENTVYPDSAKLHNTQGRVIARFVVDIDGSVKMASILKGVGPYLDEEALRVVNSLPRFSPGKQAGKEVPVWYMVPISFQLK